MAPILKLAVALALASTAAAAHLEVRQLGSHALAARKADADFNSKWLQSNYKNGDPAPGASSGDAGGQGIVIDAEGGGDDDSQVPWCNTAFVGSAAVNGSADEGWQALPQLVGFNLDRSLEVEGAVQPVYIEKKDPSLVKRIIIAQPGKPRDSWKYVNLFRNALVCAVANESLSTVLSDVMVVAPAWLSTDDQKAGAAQPTDLYFTNGGWSTGGQSRGPGDTSVSSFRVMDLLINKFFDKATYPQLSSIIVGGHSLGASFSQRYAFLRRPEASQDASVSFWVGNPGAYVWPQNTRPVTPTDTSCDATKDDWAYGVGGDLPAYRKSDTAATPANLYSTYTSRRVQYALGLLDDGPGDTHCEAQYEGNSHLQRGQNMEKALESLPGGKPSTHTFSYVPDTSHQDYKMISAVASQSYLFSEGLSTPRNSSLDSSSGKSKGNSGSSGSSNTPSAATSPSASSALTTLLGAAALAIVGFAI